jgi:hypothetical protein
MVKKGKFRLLNYFIENNLIYYKSLSKNSKIIAFALIKFLNFKPLKYVLTECLINRLIQYFAIQIDINDGSKKLILLNFQDSKKENIIKAFNSVKQSIAETYSSPIFLKDKILEKEFLSIIFNDINAKTSITKEPESILLSSERNNVIFKFFSINLGLIDNKYSFVSNFLNLINSIGRIGFLIFNFKIDINENIKVTSYFIEKNDKMDADYTIQSKVNNFFKSDIISEENIKIKTIFKFLWRLGIREDSIILNDFYNLFISEKSSPSLDLQKIKADIERNLIKNHIKYIKLSKKLFFIEESVLFIILDTLDSEYIHRILEEHYPKYIFYILILNHKGYEKLLETKSIYLIKSIKIIPPEEIHKFNYQELKKLKDS